MGKKDNAIVPFLKVKERFCDLFNGTMFQGRQVVLPEELELKDSVQTAMLQDKYRKNIL